MAVQEISFETTLTTATANAPLGSIRGDTTHRLRILEIVVVQKTAGVSPNGIGLATVSNTPAGGTTVAAEKRDPASALSTALGVVSGWTTAPTISKVFKRIYWGTAVGNAWPWTFDRLDPFTIPAGGTAGGELVIVNLFNTAPPILAVNCAFEIAG